MIVKSNILQSELSHFYLFCLNVKHHHLFNTLYVLLICKYTQITKTRPSVCSRISFNACIKFTLRDA